MPDEQPKHSYETSDANIRNLLIFAAGLSLLVIAGFVVSRSVFRYFVGHQGLGPPASPFENVRTLPAEPRLQVGAPLDLKQYEAAQDGFLNSYGWVDRQAGVVRIPIDRAMDLLLQRGFPVRTVAPGKQGESKPSRKSADTGKASGANGETP